MNGTDRATGAIFLCVGAGAGASRPPRTGATGVGFMPSFFFMPSFGGWGYGMGYGMGGAAMIVRVLMNVLLMYVLYNYLFGGRRGGRGDPNAA